MIQTAGLIAQGSAKYDPDDARSTRPTQGVTTQSFDLLAKAAEAVRSKAAQVESCTSAIVSRAVGEYTKQETPVPEAHPFGGLALEVLACLTAIDGYLDDIQQGIERL